LIIFQNVIYSCNGKAEFSTSSLLQSSGSHDPPEIILICWFAAQETLLIINVENICAVLYFVETFDEYKVQKNSIYQKYKSIALSMSLLSLQFNAFLLIKMVYFILQKSYW